MSESIVDGTGKGYEAKVDSDNRVHTFSVIEPEDKAANKNGYNWSLPFTTTPTGAGDYFFYMANTGNNDLLITDIRIYCAAADRFTINKVTGTPSYAAGGTITPVSKNLGQLRTVTATIKYDTDTTGLTDGGKIYDIPTPVANTLVTLTTSANIIIPKGTAIAMKATTGTASLTCVVSIVEDA